MSPIDYYILSVIFSGSFGLDVVIDETNNDNTMTAANGRRVGNKNVSKKRPVTRKMFFRVLISIREEWTSRVHILIQISVRNETIGQVVHQRSWRLEFHLTTCLHHECSQKNFVLSFPRRRNKKISFVMLFHSIL